MAEFDREDVLRRLEAFTAYCVEELGSTAVLLVGSYAKGTYVRRVSDVDVIVVAEKVPRRFLDRLDLLDRVDTGGLPVEALIYTPKELETMLDEGRPGIVDAVEFGVVLFGNDWFQERRAQLARLKKRGLVRTPVGTRMPKADTGC